MSSGFVKDGLHTLLEGPSDRFEINFSEQGYFHHDFNLFTSSDADEKVL